MRTDRLGPSNSWDSSNFWQRCRERDIGQKAVDLFNELYDSVTLDAAESTITIEGAKFRIKIEQVSE